MQTGDCYIIRDGVKSGPYEARHILQFVASGDVLLQDTIECKSLFSDTQSVRIWLKRTKLTYNLPDQRGLLDQLRNLRSSLILPTKDDMRNKIFKDQKVLLMFAVGLSPLLIIMLLGGASQLLTFYLIAVYFSFVWAIFYLILFRTSQVKMKVSLGLFFTAQVSTLVITSLQGVIPFSFVYSLTDSSNFIFRLVGFILGVGFLEEVAKTLPLYLFVLKYREPLVPRTLVYYGLVSGLGFGTVEGVMYQIGVNAEFDYSTAYFLNVARLTTLPFLHSVWSAISAFFISFHFLVPRYRNGLLLVAIAIPAILHGVYDTLTIIPILALASSGIAVVLLVHFLTKAQEFRTNMNSLK